MKSERKTYYLHSGEGDGTGTWEVVTVTEIGIKRRLTKERRGDRWAHAFTVTDDPGAVMDGLICGWNNEIKKYSNFLIPKHLIEKARREKAEINRAGRPKLPDGTRVTDMDRVCVYMRPDEVAAVNEAARQHSMSRQVYLHSKIFG